jgi:hypothetical protein
MSLSFLFIKDAASALRDGMNNPDAVEAKSRFMTNQATGRFPIAKDISGGL